MLLEVVDSSVLNNVLLVQVAMPRRVFHSCVSSLKSLQILALQKVDVELVVL